MTVQRRSDGEKKDMGQTSVTPVKDDATTHASDPTMDKYDISKFQPTCAPTEQPVSSSPSTQPEHPTEEEHEAQHALAETSGSGAGVRVPFQCSGVRAG